MVARDALRTHGTEPVVEPGPELLQSHAPTLTRRSYPRGMLPGTGSPALDLVLEVAIIAAMLVGIVLLIKNYRGR